MFELQKAPWPNWETVSLIGRGSFGTVYEIKRCLVDGNTETAALKVIKIPQNPADVEEMYSEGYDDESITATFNSHLKNIVTEYSLMQKLEGCSNIVNCKDISYIQHADSFGWDIYIRMELLTPLLKALPADFSEETVINLGKDICNALALCKKHEIVHRDIKPQNIFVSDNGDYKLGDFGIAKTVEKTMGGTKIGTYKYMAPEVYNNQPYGTSSDIYSLGLVLYWMLNERRMPFMPLPPEKIKAGDEEEARRRRFEGEPLPPPKNGSEKLKNIVLKACAYDPDDRYESADEMLRDLNSLSIPMKTAVADAHKFDHVNEEEQDSDMTASPAFGEALEDEDATVGPVFASYESLNDTDEDATVGPVFAPPSQSEKPERKDEPVSAKKNRKDLHTISIIFYIATIIVLILTLIIALRSCDIDDNFVVWSPDQENEDHSHSEYVDDTEKPDLNTLETKSEEELYANPVQVEMSVKDYGKITLEVYPNLAPITVDNFLSLVKSGYYENTVFHRIIEGFMIQGGAGDDSAESIKGEFSSNGVYNPLKHERGVISMARTNVPDSASSQFFIMHKAASHLDGSYAAFGKVISGMDVVDAIATVDTDYYDAPYDEIVIEYVKIIETATDTTVADTTVAENK